MTRPKQTCIAGGVTALVLGAGGYWIFRKRGKAGREIPMGHGAQVQAPNGGEAAAEAFVKAQKKFIKTLNPKTATTTPKQRLGTVFGIDNILTTEDDQRGSEFRAEAVTKLQEAIGLPIVTTGGVREANWTHVIESIEEAVHKVIGDAKGERSLTLAMLVQTATLEASLKYLSNLESYHLRDLSTMSVMAERINALWLASKHPEAEDCMPEWKDQHDLHEMLRTITGLDPAEPEEQPHELHPASLRNHVAGRLQRLPGDQIPRRIEGCSLETAPPAFQA